tara:strand:+ start:272 stop:955 length:684 start_codon:yes stop_codon:yes gene_type:complete
MKKIFFITVTLIVSMTLSAQNRAFNVREIKAKDYSQEQIEATYEQAMKDVELNQGYVALQWVGAGSDNGVTHRLVWSWPLGVDMWEGNDMSSRGELWWSKMSNHAEWGEQYSGRVLSWQDGTNEEYNTRHIWDFKVENSSQFKNAHDKMVKKFKKEFEGRSVGFGTYDINRPNGATHWVIVSGKDDHEHMMLYDKLQSQSEFVNILKERGKVELVKDYMVGNLKSYQ